MLEKENSLLVIIDVQEKLFKAMYGNETLRKNLIKIVMGMQSLDIPILWLEQNPKGLGPTIPEVAALLAPQKPISKLCFSSLRNQQFKRALYELRRNQILLVGIEAHVCVYQTALDLAESGYEVEVVVDAVSSRTEENKNIALHKMRDLDIKITSTEIALFEILKDAEGEQFRQILKIVK
jgi:nicotinamidase-related amidase